MKYCIYLTIYSGAKLPKRYIGSSSVNRVVNGYNGTITSRTYREVYKQEQIDNKHLFKTRILAKFNTREEALTAEKELQMKYAVHKSELYMNMAIAVPNGFFGMSQCGDKHPMYNKHHTDVTKNKISNTLKEQYSNGTLVTPFKDLDNSGKNNPFYGKTHNSESKDKMRKPKTRIPRWPHPETGRLYISGNLTQVLKRKGWTGEQINEYKNSMEPTLTTAGMNIL
jgi:hypothetical protein